jgi:two-component system phosphate regulon response regulator PhoB
MPETLTVVVIEDEAHIRLALDYNLRMDGFTVHLAKNGREGLELVGRIHPDLVVCDWMMPEMNGLEVVSHLKADPQLKAIPVVVLTAKSMDGERQQVMAAGADECITKPFDPIQLGQMLREVRTWMAPPTVQPE